MQPDLTFTNVNTRAELAGTFNTWVLTHEVLIGASQNVRDAKNSTSVAATCPGATPTAPRVTCTQNFFNPRDIPETAMPLRTGDETRIDDVGYYFFDRVKVTEWLQLLGGVRTVRVRRVESHDAHDDVRRVADIDLVRRGGQAAVVDQRLRHVHRGLGIHAGRSVDRAEPGRAVAGDGERAA